MFCGSCALNSVFFKSVLQPILSLCPSCPVPWVEQISLLFVPCSPCLFSSSVSFACFSQPATLASAQPVVRSGVSNTSSALYILFPSTSSSAVHCWLYTTVLFSHAPCNYFLNFCKFADMKAFFIYKVLILSLKF